MLLFFLITMFYFSDCKVWKFRRSDVHKDVLPNDIKFKFLQDGQVLSTIGASVR